ncbi:MAG TPA: ethanolamine ammonia-lyase subunit EutC [Ohtaekwangia sp.]|uniref:ethanolamine ammonia-lyase subunit EutC n=1 Tax=Ohtaekwangia sp. TaxID=2066019 RepID=UPI002F9206D6
MTPDKKPVAASDSWQSLQTFTAARIALGRTGVSVPIQEALKFKLAHAHARDAVYSLLETQDLAIALESLQLPVYRLKSQAGSREEYLKRPDHGRRLHTDAVGILQQSIHPAADIAIVLADGLSATAINVHAIPVLQELISSLKDTGYTLAPVTLVEQGRVGIGDEIGFLLNAKLVIILIGERPGLSSPDSMGAYITYAPSVGLTDEARNCISNIRPEGLSYKEAANKIFYLVQEALRRKLSGVQLKDNSGELASGF